MKDDMDNDILTKAQELLDASSPGLWVLERPENGVCDSGGVIVYAPPGDERHRDCTSENCSVCRISVAWDVRPENAELFVFAHNDLSVLLERLRRAEQQLALFHAWQSKRLELTKALDNVRSLVASEASTVSEVMAARRVVFDLETQTTEAFRALDDVSAAKGASELLDLREEVAAWRAERDARSEFERLAADALTAERAFHRAPVGADRGDLRDTMSKSQKAALEAQLRHARANTNLMVFEVARAAAKVTT